MAKKVVDNGDLGFNGDVTIRIQGEPWTVSLSGRGYVCVREVKGKKEVYKYLPDEIRYSPDRGTYDEKVWQAGMREIRDEAIQAARKLAKQS